MGNLQEGFRASLPRDKEVWFRELQSSLNTTSVTRRNDSNQEAEDSRKVCVGSARDFSHTFDFLAKRQGGIARESVHTN